MKENSIEEDIKILEKKIEDYKPYKNIEYCSHAGQILQEEYKALEHILSDYKRVVKENETLKNFVSSIFNEDIEKDYIPVQRIKDKIEELDNQQKQWLEDRELKASNREIIFARDVLQGLLEEGETKG